MPAWKKILRTRAKFQPKPWVKKLSLIPIKKPLINAKVIKLLEVKAIELNQSTLYLNSSVILVSSRKYQDQQNDKIIIREIGKTIAEANVIAQKIYKAIIGIAISKLAEPIFQVIDAFIDKNNAIGVAIGTFNANIIAFEDAQQTPQQIITKAETTDAIFSSLKEAIEGLKEIDKIIVRFIPKQNPQVHLHTNMFRTDNLRATATQSTQLNPSIISNMPKFNSLTI